MSKNYTFTFTDEANSYEKIVTVSAPAVNEAIKKAIDEFNKLSPDTKPSVIKFEIDTETM